MFISANCFQSLKDVIRLDTDPNEASVSVLIIVSHILKSLKITIKAEAWPECRTKKSVFVSVNCFQSSLKVTIRLDTLTLMWLW